MGINLRLTAETQRRRENHGSGKPLCLCVSAVKNLAFVGLLLAATAANAALPIQHWQMENGVRVYFRREP